MTAALVDLVETNPASIPRLLSVADIARIFGINETTVYAWIKAKRLPDPIRVSRRVLRWRPADIDAMITGRWPCPRSTPS